MRHSFEVRMHGVGGQGVAVTADLLAFAAVLEGQWAHSFPFFGTEIRGGLVSAFARISSQPIHNRSFIDRPDLAVFFSAHGSLGTLCEGLTEETSVLVNADPATFPLDPSLPGDWRVIDFDALARSIPGCRMSNCIILGAVAALSQKVALGSVERAIGEWFPAEIAAVNQAGAKLGYQTARERTPA